MGSRKRTLKHFGPINCLGGHLSFLHLLQTLAAIQEMELEEITEGVASSSIDRSEPLEEQSFLDVCKAGDLETLEKLLDSTTIDFNQTDRFGQSGFMFACWKGHVEAVK